MSGGGINNGSGVGGDTLRIGTTSKRPSVSLRDLQQGEEKRIKNGGLKMKK